MLAISNLRKNHSYRIVNFDEELTFTVLDVISDENYLIKTIDSLEIMELKDILQYGVSSSYELDELSDD